MRHKSFIRLLLVLFLTPLFLIPISQFSYGQVAKSGKKEIDDATAFAASAGQQGLVIRDGGHEIQGRIVSLTESEVKINNGRNVITVAGKDLKRVQSAAYVFDYDPNQKVIRRVTVPDPIIKAFNDARGQISTILRNNGYEFQATIVSINEMQVIANDGRRILTLPAGELQSVRTARDTFTFDEKNKGLESARADEQRVKQEKIAKQEQERQELIVRRERERQELIAKAERERLDRIATEALRRGRVKITNTTSERVQITVTAIRDVEGGELVLQRTPSNSNLVEVLEAFSGKKTPPSSWNIDAGKSTYLSFGDDVLTTSRLNYTLTTEHGSKSWVIEKKSSGGDFEVSINKQDLHTPVLAKVGRWNWEQNIQYTTERGRTPTSIVPVEAWTSRKIIRFDVIGGQEYNFTKEERSGVVSAWADIENPTDKPLKVVVTLEFHFTHWLLSHERVAGEITIPAKGKERMFFHADTLAFVGNRKATGVNQIDVTTTPTK